jgi:hypothetical protein
MTRALLAGALLAATASPALADVDKYFVALDTTINQCRVMSTQPDGTTMKMVGSHSYQSLDDAQDAMARLPECKT